ncbi:YegP family protein [Halococcus hamelinensis]|uniref:DUF1508 domain-containing protein n=1 Tax=Halococcus hamelinensis 100A6 TaxID=1132509 RepID=M0M9W8_9EURY|nr:DUF1508 domain-containing protein [Halococcus hamelinensis]EMA41429.1 hypothetical protein C447_01205 [Halococcus hamelinensis 100A6]
MSDHEYTLTVRPNAHLRVAYNADREGLERLVLAFEYGRDGLDHDDAASGVDWHGYEVALARDGHTLLGDNGEASRAIERAFDRGFDDDRVKRGVDAAKGYGQRLRNRVETLRGSADVGIPGDSVEPPETIEVPGPGGRSIDVSLTETAATFELYEDGGGNWRWRLMHDDGRTLAVSPSGYDSRETAEELLTALKTNALGAEVKE